MWQKFKNYFTNSPGRIAAAWTLLHILLLCVALLKFEPGMLVSGTLYVIYLFPSVLIWLILGWLPGIDLLMLSMTVFYYLLFIFICLAAKKTDGKIFIISQTIYSIFITVILMQAFASLAHNMIM
jgi:hypothetical protein